MKFSHFFNQCSRGNDYITLNLAPGANKDKAVAIMLAIGVGMIAALGAVWHVKSDNILLQQNNSGKEMTQARSEITIKFSGSLPPATPVEGKKVEAEFTDQNGIVFTAQINGKSWRKAEASVAEFADWAGMVSGKLGRTDKGFEILDAGVQIFEKKPKEPKPQEAVAAA